MDLLDRVAEEVDPYGVLLSRREDVDDAAPDGELTTSLHQVDPGVRRADERRAQLAQVIVLPDHQSDRTKIAETLDLRMQDAADRCDHDPRRRQLGVLVAIVPL